MWKPRILISIILLPYLVNKQAAWRAAIQTRESLESGPGEDSAIAEKESEALASLESAKNPLKSSIRSLFKASNLSPPVMDGSSGKRQLMMQQAAQMGMHAFCLHLLDGLDECWQKARHLGDHPLLSYDKVSCRPCLCALPLIE